MFEMWITCSEKEAKWKLNNFDLCELGKKARTHTILNKWDLPVFSAAHSVVRLEKKIKVGKYFFFFTNYIKNFARFGKQSQRKLLLMDGNLVKNEQDMLTMKTSVWF